VRNVKQAFGFTSVNETQGHEDEGKRNYQIHKSLTLTLNKYVRSASQCCQTRKKKTALTEQARDFYCMRG